MGAYHTDLVDAELWPKIPRLTYTHSSYDSPSWESVESKHCRVTTVQEAKSDQASLDHLPVTPSAEESFKDPLFGRAACATVAAT